MNSLFTNGLRVMSGFSLLLLTLACCELRVIGQDELIVPSLFAPPPMKFIPVADRMQLSGVQDAKTRLKTCIGLAETRLLRAEQFTVDQRFISANSELGVYQAIIEDALRFLSGQKTDSNKTRDMYKRLEIQLRVHALRIEAIRRVTPAAYAIHVKATWDFSDGARAKALNAFFSDTVVPLEATESGKTSGDQDSRRTP